MDVHLSTTLKVLAYTKHEFYQLRNGAHLLCLTYLWLRAGTEPSQHPDSADKIYPERETDVAIGAWISGK
jgi:hypothetical protein